MRLPLVFLIGFALPLHRLSLCRAPGYFSHKAPAPLATLQRLAPLLTLRRCYAQQHTLPLTPFQDISNMEAAAAAPPPPLVPMEGDKDVLAGWSCTIESLFDSGHHKWGFLVYRVTYDDDDAWRNFMHILNRNTEKRLDGQGKLQRLGPYLHWTVMEDSAFNGASKDAIRDHFRHWVETRTVDRDGPGADREDISKRSPRYRYCIYADKAALESATMEEFNKYNMEFIKVKGDVVLIDSQFGHRVEEPLVLDEYELQELADGEYTMEDLQDDAREYEPIEGRVTYDVGWMYVKLQSIGSAYERLAETGSVDEWEDTYKRPPHKWPSDRD
jgi:hypothetical protein